MARSIEEIKKDMTDRYLSYETIRNAYGLPEGANFENTFSKVSIESIIFYVVAFSTWVLEILFDVHEEEVSNTIAESKPGTLRWLVNKAKEFMPGYNLVTDTDYYDTSGMTSEQITNAQVVKHAAAVENNSIVYLKVAGDVNGVPGQLAQEYIDGLRSYIKEIKYAGVEIRIVNEPADHYRLQMIVYYDPKILNSSGAALLGGDPVRDAIRNFLRSLPFNGEYRNVDLVDTLQAVDGVVIPELILPEVSVTGLEGSWRQVEAIAIPDSGYYKIYDEDNEMNLTFRPYEAIPS